MCVDFNGGLGLGNRYIGRGHSQKVSRYFVQQQPRMFVIMLLGSALLQNMRHVHFHLPMLNEYLKMVLPCIISCKRFQSVH